MSKIYTIKFSHIPVTQIKPNQAVAGAIEIRTAKIAAFVRLNGEILRQSGDARMTTCLRPWGIGLSDEEMKTFATQEVNGRTYINSIYVDLDTYSNIQALRPETMYSLWYELGLVHYALTNGETMNHIRPAREKALEAGELSAASLDAEAFAVRHTSAQAALKSLETLSGLPHPESDLAAKEYPLRIKMLEEQAAEKAAR
ncbi:hypothetical protein [Cloacibacillus sp. An23]|uniref:hypothetical protein n=1 Tax=Cloacibacillus sp. An23 TaxID=1965591 RepID=UPI000B396A19|nr:hypothetical protein [Cloacibacillus sp. An23]OUO95167.1 hypothetical protein B5F39_01160 [Cloacibacillus sp. An23]